MKIRSHTSQSICPESFSHIYMEYKKVISAYIAYRIPHKYEAEDLTQDVFMRLLDCGKVINEETVSSFLYTVARNLITDTLRRYYKKQEVMAEWECDAPSSSCTTEQTVYANELASIYKQQIQKLPRQRRKVYELIDCHDLSIAEAAERLSLSQRTVQNHLYIARNEIKTQLCLLLEAV